MGCRRQSKHQQTSLRVTETGHRLSPILFITEGRTLLASDPFTPLNKPWTSVTLDDLIFKLSKRGLGARIG